MAIMGLPALSLLHPLQAGGPLPCPRSLSADRPHGPSPRQGHSCSSEVSRASRPLSEHLPAQQAAVLSGNN